MSLVIGIFENGNCVLCLVVEWTVGFKWFWKLEFYGQWFRIKGFSNIGGFMLVTEFGYWKIALT